jgi:uncharacterized MAPEG superfamily protein
VAVEVTVLGWAVLLAVVQLALFAVPANRQLGPAYTAGPRDEKRELTGVPARLQRAFANHVEGLVLFTAAVAVVTLGEASTPVTRTAALLYLGARVFYVPAYALGAPYLRSLIWAVGFCATVTMVVVALF